MDAKKRPGGEGEGRRKAAPRAPLRRPGQPRPARGEPLEEEAAVEVASAPSSSGREKPPEDDAEEASAEPRSSEVEGEEGEAAAEGDGAEGEPAAPTAEDETVEVPAPTRERRSARQKAERKGKTERNPAVKAKPASGTSRRMRPEADPGGGEGFSRGISLGVKIALFTAVLVAVCMGVLGYNLGSTATSEIDKQINEKGVAAAKAFAFQPKAIIFQKSLEDAPEREAEIAAWQRSLARFVEKEPLVLNVMYLWDEKQLVTNHQVTVELAGVPPRGDSVATAPIAERDGVRIEEGQYQGAGFSGRVRKYVLKVEPVKVDAPARRPRDATDPDPDPDPDDRPPPPRADAPAADAWVHVFLKADEVDKVADEVRSRILVLCGVGIGIAVLLSIAVAAYLAMPLRSLVDDIHAVADGDLDHETTPRTADEIGLVAYQFNEMTKSLRAARQLEQERQAIEHELTIATEIQTKLLPERIPQIPGIDLYSFYLSAKEVGGDYYDFLIIDPTHLGIIVADVSGKGIPGAMVMTMVRSLLRLASHRETSPAETLKKVNRILAKDIRRGMFVTAIYAVLDVQRKRLTVSSAGHNPMVFYEAATRETRAVSPSGIALGFDKGRTFDENIREETIDLRPGDRCVFYTDGVVEAMSEKHEEFGMERFQALVQETASRSSKDFTNAVVEDLEAHRGRGEQSDDITITTLRVE